MQNKEKQGPAAALAGLRVIELASPMSQYCGKMFAELGAEVILVEPPEGQGAQTRSVPPFIDGVAGPDRSMAFEYFNGSKRGITLDLDSGEGQALFRKLAADADLVVEAEKPGVMAARGCGYAELKALKPSLVVLSITGFGQTGPYAQYESSDLIALATGGFMYLGGYSDSPPLAAYGDQALLGAGMYGAVSAMIALTAAELSGEGEHIDVSMQECMTMAMETAVQFFDLEGKVRKRNADEQRYAGTGVYACQDGYIYAMFAGIGANKFWPISLQWFLDEKIPAVERLQGREWHSVDYVHSAEGKRIFAEVFGPWAMHKTKSYLYHEGQRRHIPIAPINDTADILASKQFAHRKFFIDAVHAATGKKLRMPGAPYQFSATPWRRGKSAPALGEHNDEILAPLATDQPVRRSPKSIQASRLPLAGIRVTDFAWIGAGAYATKILADAGAEVIRIESRQRVDSLRLAAPYKDGILGVNRSGYFADRNTSKRSITLDMKHPKALALVEKLIRQSDIIANTFTPGVMERFGLDYEAVRAMKPDIIFLTMSMSGGSGPERSYSGYGSGMASITGLQHLTAFPGREPAGTGTNYPDHVPNPCHATFAVLAALRHRRRTGEGQRIDIAQTEPTVALLGPTMLDYTVNGLVQQPPGNAHPVAAPHGAYPCQGEDRWIAIAVLQEEHWQSLRGVLGDPQWMQEVQWANAQSRHARREELDRLLGTETRRHVAETLMQQLQARGVPAGVVATAEDVVRRDPQLAHRSHWLTLDHPEMGRTIYNAPPYRFLEHPVTITVPAPLIGQHTEEVCSEQLGLTRDEFKALADEGVFN